MGVLAQTGKGRWIFWRVGNVLPPLRPRKPVRDPPPLIGATGCDGEARTPFPQPPPHLDRMFLISLRTLRRRSLRAQNRSQAVSDCHRTIEEQEMFLQDAGPGFSSFAHSRRIQKGNQKEKVIARTASALPHSAKRSWIISMTCPNRSGPCCRRLGFLLFVQNPNEKHRVLHERIRRLFVTTERDLASLMNQHRDMSPRKSCLGDRVDSSAPLAKPR